MPSKDKTVLLSCNKYIWLASQHLMIGCEQVDFLLILGSVSMPGIDIKVVDISSFWFFSIIELSNSAD